MKTTLLLTGALLALLAPRVIAAGVSLNWGTGCWSDGTPLNDLAFICNRNTGSATMTVSFAISSDQPQFRGVEVQIGGASEAATLPSWWQMAPGECRASAVSASASFLSAPRLGCTDVWGGQAVSSLLYEDGEAAGWPNRVWMTINCGLPSPVQLSAGVEYYACQVTIDYRNSVGQGLCAGCYVPMIFGLYSVKAIGTEWYEVLLCELPQGNLCIRWQHSILSCYPPTNEAAPLDDCVQTVAMRNKTWGGVKSMYR